jgi:hypothetical protein
MSLSSELSAAFSEAQGLVAQATGMTGSANTLYNGAPYVFTYGQPQPQNQMMPGGGYRQRTVVPFTATRAQFTVAPEKNKTLTRTDLSPQLTYRIEVVNLHDPYHYTGVLIRVGE